ncbi:MAG: hypothetical protein RLZ98_1828, partial [Pseudomonadota bacterium]
PFRTRVKIKTEAHLPDDLTAIRGVDKSLAAQLAGLGITRFRQIAEWEPQHVREVSEKLGLGRKISRQNWIEQAAVLAAVDAIGLPTSSVREAVSNAEVCAAPNGHAAIPEPARRPEPVTQPSSGLDATAADAGASCEPTGAQVSLSRPSPAEPDSSEAAIAVPVDRLRLIDGLDETAERLLNEGGITSWRQIAEWSAQDVADWQQKIGGSVQITKTGWIEQAAILSAGQLTRYAEEELAGTGTLDEQQAGSKVHAVRRRPSLLARLKVIDPTNEDTGTLSETEHGNSSGPQPPVLPNKDYDASLKALVARADQHLRQNRSAHPHVPVTAMTAAVREPAPEPQADEAAAERLAAGSGAPPPGRTLRNRLDRLRVRPRFDAKSYAAYRGTPEEAMVEIVRREDADAATPDANTDVAPKDRTESSVQTSSRLLRLLNSLRGAKAGA